MKVNIYLTKDQKNKLNDIMLKHHVSKSTIAEKILYYFTKYVLKQNNGKELLEKIGSQWVIDNKGTKTSIKPKLDPVNNQFYKNNSKAYTNVIVLYLTGKIKDYIMINNINGFYNDLNTDLQKTVEENWDYNSFIRNMKRFESRERK